MPFAVFERNGGQVKKLNDFKFWRESSTGRWVFNSDRC